MGLLEQLEKMSTSELLEIMEVVYKEGFIDGATNFAWWKDGTQYCGTNTRLSEVKNNPEKNYNYTDKSTIYQVIEHTVQKQQAESEE